MIGGLDFETITGDHDFYYVIWGKCDLSLDYIVCISKLIKPVLI